MAPRPFKECTYSAFVSYAHSDDESWNHWVTCFVRELELTLPGRLRIGSVPGIHLSAKNGPVSGDLDDSLTERIRGSFAMVLVVHENYLDSGWCKKELALFRSIFGDAALRERLYIIALSKRAVTQLIQSADWRAVSSGRNLVHIPFYSEDAPEQPISIYRDSPRGVVTTAFWEPFVRFRESLADKIKRDLSTTPGAGRNDDRPAPCAPVEPVSARQDVVRIYIESNRREVDLWEDLGELVEESWRRITASMQLVPPLHVRPHGLPIDTIDEHPRLEDADGVILLWGSKTADSLIAQIDKVERKIPSYDIAPGMVAYLTPPQAESSEPVPAHNWPVLRFLRGTTPVQIERDDAHAMERFLRRVIRRKLRISTPPTVVTETPP